MPDQEISNIVAQIKYILARNPAFGSEWENYKALMLPDDLAVEDVSLFEQVFYAGGLVALSILNESPEKEVTMVSLRIEISAYFDLLNSQANSVTGTETDELS